jgi:hypothetical protein
MVCQELSKKSSITLDYRGNFAGTFSLCNFIEDFILRFDKIYSPVPTQAIQTKNVLS